MSQFLNLIDEEENKEKNLNISFVPSRKFEYNPYEYPPNFELAEDHLLATRIAQPAIKEGVVNIDEATGLPVDNELAPLCINLYDMNFVSAGYPLYLQFINFSVQVAFGFLTLSGIYNMYTNYHGATCVHIETLKTPPSDQYMTQNCIYSIITALSLANKINDEYTRDWTEFFNLLTIIVLCLYLHFLRIRQRKTANICDERAVTPSDFTIRVRDIPTDFPPDVKVGHIIREWFENHGLPGRRLDVKKVNLVFDVREKLSIQRNIDQLMVEKFSLERGVVKKTEDEKRDDLTRIELELQKLRENLAVENREFRKGFSEAFMGECYITLETQQEVQEVLEYWSLSSQERKRIKMSKSSVEHKFDGYVLRVEQAGEPSDVYWENNGVPTRHRFMRRCLTLAGTGLILVASFFLILEIKVGNDYVSKLLVGPNTDSQVNQAAASILAQVASYAIVFINSFLDSTFEHFTEFDKYSTHSTHVAHYTMKLSVATFFNTTIITLILSLKAGNLWGVGGLTTSIYYVFMNDAIIPVILGFVDSGFWIQTLKRAWLRYRGDKCALLQKDLNKFINVSFPNFFRQFEYPGFDFASKYSYYVKTLWSAAFYAPFVPSILVWVCLGFFLRYWQDKYHMLRHRSRGSSLGSEMSIEFMAVFEYALYLFAAGNLFFMIYIRGVEPGQLIMTIIGFSICTIQAFVPSRWLNEYLFSVKSKTLTNDRYSECRLNFLEDYDRANPATCEEAIEAFTRERQGQPPLIHSTVKKSQMRGSLVDLPA